MLVKLAVEGEKFVFVVRAGALEGCCASGLVPPSWEEKRKAATWFPADGIAAAILGLTAFLGSG